MREKDVFVRTAQPKTSCVANKGGAAWRMLHAHMKTYNEAACVARIEDYANGGDGGLTRRAMRAACSLPPVPESTSSPSGQPAGSPSHTDVMIDLGREGMRKDTDLLTQYMLDHDMESITEANLRLATSVQMGDNADKRCKRFRALVQMGFGKHQ